MARPLIVWSASHSHQRSAPAAEKTNAGIVHWRSRSTYTQKIALNTYSELTFMKRDCKPYFPRRSRHSPWNLAPSTPDRPRRPLTSTDLSSSSHRRSEPSSPGCGGASTLSLFLDSASASALLLPPPDCFAARATSSRRADMASRLHSARTFKTYDVTVGRTAEPGVVGVCFERQKNEESNESMI